MLESKFQSKVIKELKDRLPGCMVLKNDPTYLQGVPDLLVLYKDKWCALEVKRSETAKHQPNQDYYVNKMNEMSHSAFIYPENKDAVIKSIVEKFNSKGV